MNTGLRIGEVCALQWDDLDFQNNILHVRHTISRISNNDEKAKSRLILDTPKTKSSLRDIPIPTKILSLLKEMKKKILLRLCCFGQKRISESTHI